MKCGKHLRFLVFLLLETMKVPNVVATTPDNISITKTNLGRNHTRGELIFHDDFDTLDLETWFHESTLGSNDRQFQAYINSRRNSYAKNGSLFIKPTLSTDIFDEWYLKNEVWSVKGAYPVDMCTDPMNYGCEKKGFPNAPLNPAVSAKLKTVNSFYFKYGRVEIRAKLPAGDWMWPSISLTPRFNNYGKWPRSGDLRMMDSRGNQLFLDGKTKENVGTERFTFGVHFGPEPWLDRYDWANGWKQSTAGRGFDKDFHTYGVIWTDRLIQFSLDGMEIRTIWPPEGGFWEYGAFAKETKSNPWESAERKIMAPFDHKFFLTLGVAVGGDLYFADDAVNEKGPKPWKNYDGNAYLDFFEKRGDWFHTWAGDDGAFQIDYIKVFAI